MQGGGCRGQAGGKCALDLTTAGGGAQSLPVCREQAAHDSCLLVQQPWGEASGGDWSV